MRVDETDKTKKQKCKAMCLVTTDMKLISNVPKIEDWVPKICHNHESKDTLQLCCASDKIPKIFINALTLNVNLMNRFCDRLRTRQ